jgi:nucleoside 2-deoxyribosyltransferase
MRAFLICPVRNATETQKSEIEKYIESTEARGVAIYYPARDTNQNDPVGYTICYDNLRAMQGADEVHIFYDPRSAGSLFDLGMAFALGKPVRVANTIEHTEGKSFANMVLQWSEQEATP